MYEKVGGGSGSEAHRECPALRWASRRYAALGPPESSSRTPFQACPTLKAWGEGLRRCAGAFAADWTEDDDRILEEIYRDRKSDSRKEILELNLLLNTTITADFQNIPGLQVDDWLAPQDWEKSRFSEDADRHRGMWE